MFWLEVIGVIAFGICGAMAAMERGADLFGVLFLAVITALGGGVIRDVLLGWFPPRMFTSYAYVAIAVASALLVFLDACIRREHYRQNRDKLDSVVNVFDALGLGVFTVSGVQMAIDQYGMGNPFLLVLCGLAVSTLAGFINGTLLTRLDLPHPFVSTMGMKNVLWGLALVITGSKSIAFTNTGIDGLMWIGGGSLFTTYYEGTTKVKFPGIPFSFVLVIIVFIIFDIFLRKTALGRQIYCVGGNPEAARLSGIPSKNVLTFVYTLSGFMAGMAGIVSVGRLASANGNAGSTYDNDAIAACIVGGASFTGGKGTIWGTLIGALLMAVIRNGLNLAGAKNDVQYIVIGSVIILAVTIDVFRNKMEAKARKMAAQ